MRVTASFVGGAMDGQIIDVLTDLPEFETWIPGSTEREVYRLTDKSVLSDGAAFEVLCCRYQLVEP